MKKLFSKIHPVFALILAVYCALGIYGIKFYQYQINPDGVSYIAIAEKYLAGNFADAINGYWMPLYSWLLMPFLALGIFPLLATKILGLCIGLLALIGARWLASRFGLGELTKNILLLSLVPLFIFFVFNRISPDFLIVCVLIFYLAVIFDPSYANGRYGNGLPGGVLGALAYLAKGYGLPFFLMHFIIFNSLHFISAKTRIEKKNVFKNLAGGLIVFFLISGSWIFLISQKYRHLTFNTAAGYNYALVETGNVFHDRALLSPPNATAVSYWEDPSLVDVSQFAYRKANARMRVQSLNDSTKQSRSVAQKNERTKKDFTRTTNKLQGLLKKTALLKRNLEPTIAIFKRISGFAFVVLLAALWHCRPWRREKLHSSVFYSLLTLAIYSFGYMLIAVEDRYFWIAAVLLMMLAAYFFDTLLKLKNSLLHGTATVVMMAAVMFSFGKVPADFLFHNKGTSRQHYELSQKLKYGYAIQGNIASDVDWSRTLYLSYFNGYKYYGVTGRSKSIFQKLKKNNIDYYFVWNDDADFYFPFKEITGGQISGLRIYNLRERDHLAIAHEKMGVKKKPADRISALAPFSCCAGRLPALTMASETPWVTAIRDTLRIELVESGEIEAMHSTIVEIPLIETVDLQIIDIAPEGEQIDSGAVLVRLDPQLLLNSLKQERSELLSYRNELEGMRIVNELKMSELKHQVERAEYSLQLARIDLQVLQYGSGSRKKQGELEVLKSEIALKEAKTNLQNGQVLQAPAEIQQQLKISLQQRTVNRLQQQLEQMTVRAPIAGMVVYLLDENGEKPQIGEKMRMGQGIINLSDLSRMQVRLKANVMDAVKLQVGQKALVHLEAFPDRHFRATLVSLSNIPALLEADSQVRVFEAVIEIVDSPQGRAILKPGMTAKVNLLLEEIPNAVLLPIQCVYEIDGVPVVFTEKSGAKPVPVKVGARNNCYISVAGLEPDEKVAWEPMMSEARPLGYAEFCRRQRQTMEDYDFFFAEMEKRRITFDYDAARHSIAKLANSTNGIKALHQ